MTAVESSNVAAVDFNPEARVIRVEFKNGGVYDYLDCDQELYDEFLGASSKGTFLNQRIKGFKDFVTIKKAPKRRKA